MRGSFICRGITSYSQLSKGDCTVSAVYVSCRSRGYSCSILSSAIGFGGHIRFVAADSLFSTPDKSSSWYHSFVSDGRIALGEVAILSTNGCNAASPFAILFGYFNNF